MFVKISNEKEKYVQTENICEINMFISDNGFTTIRIDFIGAIGSSEYYFDSEEEARSVMKHLTENSYLNSPAYQRLN